MNQTVKFGIILLIFTAISGGVLAFSNSITEPIIAERQRESSFGAFLDIFADAEHFIEIDEERLEEIKANNMFIREIYEVKVGEETTAYAFNTVSGGYGGDIVTITGINLDGTLAGMKVVQNSETPGLGTRIVDDENFVGSFIGRSAENDLVAVASPSADNEILLLSGVTVSIDGVLAGVNGARRAFTELVQ